MDEKVAQKVINDLATENLNLKIALAQLEGELNRLQSELEEKEPKEKE